MTFENIGVKVVEAADAGGLMAEYDGQPGERPNVVRLVADGYDWQALREQGLVVRPTWIHWICPVATGAGDVLARQSGKQRQLCRPAMRALAAMEVDICDPIDPALYDEWIGLYAAQVGELRHGRNLARFFRPSILAPGSEHGLITWRRRGRLVCGCVFRTDAARSALVGRFGAVAADERGADLSRGMYMALADMAAQRGLRWVTLGSDVNFYGAFVNAGLCAYKLRLGFRAVPAKLFGRDGSRDVAERLISLDGLEPPVLRFEYQGSNPDRTVEEFFDGPARLSLVSATPPVFESKVFDSLPGHRRMVLDA